MKAYFHGEGYREITSWSCPWCENFHTCGMDLSVTSSTREHLSACAAFLNYNPVPVAVEPLASSLAFTPNELRDCMFLYPDGQLNFGVTLDRINNTIRKKLK